jgi:uncharacterized protein
MFFCKTFSGRRLPNELNFEWDEAKALSNLAKHGISFDTGELVFRTPFFIDIDVTRANDREVRFARVGLVGSRLLTVIFTLRAAEFG